MRKTRKQHEKDIVEVIRENGLVCFTHVFGYYTELSKSRAYDLELDKSDSIREALDENRAKATSTLFDRWVNSNNPTLQLAAYRLACSDEERRRLNQQYIESRQSVSLRSDSRSPEEIADEIDRLGVLRQIAEEGE